MNLRQTSETLSRRRITIVESDTVIAQKLVAAMIRNKTDNASIAFEFTNEVIECEVISTQREFFDTDPATWDLIIAASHITDGSGFDVLSYVQGLRPDVPVIVTGTPDEADAAVEAVRAGAADYLILTGHEMISLPVTVQKCLALQVIRTENDGLHAELSHSFSELAVANRELQQMIQRLEIAARTDDLTKLSNRR